MINYLGIWLTITVIAIALICLLVTIYPLIEKIAKDRKPKEKKQIIVYPNRTGYKKSGVQ